MEKTFSSAWKASKKPNKQRKYRLNAPLHIKRKFLSAHLSPELRKKYAKRSITLVVGDTVKIMRGNAKGKEAKVERLETKRIRVFVTGIERLKKDGKKMLLPLQPSNLMITALKLDDKLRKDSVEKNQTSQKQSQK